MKTSIFTIGIVSISLAVSFCKKDSPKPQDPEPSPVYIRMTDAPAPYTAVNIDLQAVEITGNNGNTILLNTTAGIYDLLKLSNGLDTLIATGSLNVERVQQIRLILGPNNSVVTGTVSHPMNVPSAEQIGLKIQVHQDLQAGVAYYVLLDFDANKSVVDEGNGKYHLKPVIRSIESALSGSIKGQLSLAGVNAVMTANGGGNTYTSVPDAAGNFIIKGLPAGTYTVNVSPAPPNNTVNINNVNVTTGVTTTLGVVNI